jgi:transglutaminase-like putative cysteine protease
VYLREENKGAYTGKGEHGFSGDYTYEVDSGDPDPNQFFANALSASRYSSHYVDVELKADLLRLYPYYNNKIYESDVGIMQYRARTYAYQYNYSTMRSLSTISSYNKTWGNAEDAYYKFVKDNYLSVPNDLKQTLKKLAKENGLNANSSTIISDVAYYIQNAAYYDDYYANRNYPSDKDMVTCFLTEYKRGVCRHFAAAATMMFRTLGIPARYTIGFAVDVDAGEWRVYGDDPGEVGHAWTEIYIQDYGWIPLEVTGGNLYTGA